MRPKSKHAEILTLLSVGFGLGLIPLVTAWALGFGAFVLTPILFPMTAVALGYFIVSRSARQAPWVGISLCAVGSSVPLLAVFAVLAVVNRSFHIVAILVGAPYVIGAWLIAAILLAIGAYAAGAWRPRDTSPTTGAARGPG